MKQSILLLLTVLAISFSAHAQEEAPCGPFDENCTPEGPPEDEIPVDGGVSLLAIAGFAWGVKKLKSNK